MSSTKAKTMVVKLALPPAALTNFPHEPSSSKSSSKPSSKPSESTQPSSSPDTPGPIVEPTSADTPTAAPANDIDSSLLAPPPATTKNGKKAAPKPAAAGTKRAAAAVDGPSKARGKPGPKKKQRMGDMINDPNSKGPFAAQNTLPKLGPKANMGTINANLRALDRTGKPCRKWGKKSFQIRSFTGVVWNAPTWRAPSKSSLFAEDVKSDTTGSSDSKIKDESSAVSDRSGANGDSTPVPPALNGIASSPTPIPAAS